LASIYLKEFGMKLKQLTVLMGVALLTQSAFADISVMSFSKAFGQSCSNFAGRWIGSGTIKATVIFPITCHYKGVADATPVAGNPNAYNVHVELSKSDGLCPDHETIELPGSCTNGAIHLQTDKANLHGSVNDAGTEARLEGSVKVSLSGHDIDADVSDMVLHKQ
jgi:hypothetical protein